MLELRRLSDPLLAAYLCQLESAVTSHPWSEAIYLQTLASEREQVYGLFRDEQLLAVLVSETTFDELHIHNVFVPAAMQRQGFARMVLGMVIASARREGVVRCLLEVRVSNVVAISLYQALGFTRCGLRKAYYRHEQGREDAVMMECLLS